MSHSSLSRRQLGGVVATALLGPAAPAGQEEKKPAPPSDPTAATADALLEIAKLRYGGQLDEARTKQVRANLRASVGTGQRLARKKLANRDEPAFIFLADPV